MARSNRAIAVAVMAVLALAMPVFAVQANAAKAKTVKISGTLQKADGQTLTVQTTKGPEMVMLGTTAQIRRSGKSLPASDLVSASGSRITVRYIESNGQKIAQSVTLAAPKTVAAATPAVPAAPTASASKVTKK